MATRITRQRWGNRLGSSVKGVVFGLVCFLASFLLLWWNEGNAVRQYERLHEVALAAVEIQATDAPAASDGQLVHVSGTARTEDTLEDPDFGVWVEDSIHLQRQVEMYQWQETAHSDTRTKLGGDRETVTTFSYSTTWSDRVIDSSSFYEQDPVRRNPGSMPYRHRTVSASNVELGNFVLGPELIGAIGGYQTLSLSADGVTLPPDGQLHQGYVYIGADPAVPEVGDVRVRFGVVPAGPVSIIAGQQGYQLGRSWTDSTGKPYFRVQTGTHGKAAMIAQAEQEVQMVTWLLRFVGWLVMSIGLGMVLQPLRVLADVLPILGRIVGSGLGLISALTAAILSLITIAIAWLTVRPLIGIPLLVLAVILLVVMLTRAKRNRAVAAPL